MMVSEEVKKFLFTVMPILISAFTILSITLICNHKWLTALIQIPVWLALIWWLYMKEEFFDDN